MFKNTYFEEQLMAASDFLKTATEQPWASASVFTFILDNILTVSEQLSH